METHGRELILPDAPTEREIVNGVRYLMRKASADHRYATLSGESLEIYVDKLLGERRPAVERDLMDNWDHYFPGVEFNEIRLNSHLNEVMDAHYERLLREHRAAIKTQVNLWRIWNILNGRELFFKKWDLFWLIGLCLLPVVAIAALVCLGTPSDFWFNMSWKIIFGYGFGMAFINYKAKHTKEEMYS